MKKRIIEYNEQIIEYYYAYKNNKRLYLRIDEDCQLNVTAPKSTKIDDIDTFVASNINWINKKIEKIQKKKESNIDEDIKWIYHLGKKYPIQIKSTEKTNIRITDAALEMNVAVPLEKLNISATVSAWRRFTAFYVYNSVLLRIFPIIAHQIDKYPNLKIRITKSRWGSYSSRTNTVMINSELIKYPIECIEYVIMHELCHIKYMDHSSNFYALLAEVMPDYQAREKLIKDFRK